MAAGADQRLRTRTDCGSVVAMRAPSPMPPSADPSGRSGRCRRSAQASWPVAARPPKFPPSRSASAPRRRSSPTAKSSKAFSRPPSAPNIISPAASTASANTTRRSGVCRRHPRRPQGAARENRRRHRRAGPASRHRHGREQRRRQRAGQAGARPRSLSHHRDLLRQRAGARDPLLARSAMPVAASARTRNSRSSIPT